MIDIEKSIDIAAMPRVALSVRKMSVLGLREVVVVTGQRKALVLIIVNVHTTAGTWIRTQERHELYAEAVSSSSDRLKTSKESSKPHKPCSCVTHPLQPCWSATERLSHQKNCRLRSTVERRRWSSLRVKDRVQGSELAGWTSSSLR
jgi:hypothetical protein